MTNSSSTGSLRSLRSDRMLPMLILLATLTCLGCSESESARLAISGTITMDQKAIGPVLITLVPTEPSQIGCTMIAESGTYQTTDESGPSAGAYQVVVSPLEPELEEIEARRAAKKPLFSSVKIPLKYQKPGELRVDIETGTANQVRLNLSSR